MSLADLLKKGSLRELASATSATFATRDPFSGSAIATVATVAIAIAPDTTVIDPDRWCWPHSSAMNGAEIDTFMLREAGFKAKGVADAEALADTLVIRDRELDDRWF